MKKKASHRRRHDNVLYMYKSQLPHHKPFEFEQNKLLIASAFSSALMQAAAGQRQPVPGRCVSGER